MGYKADGWSRRDTIVIDYTKVSTATHTNFPIAIKDSDFSSDIYTYAKSDGSDIRFSSDVDGDTPLAFYVGRWTPGSSKAHVRVRIPSLSHTVDTTIYCWYGNSGASALAADDTYGSENCWSQNYQGVWTLEGNYNDITANGYNLTGSGTPVWTNEQIGNNLTLSGDDYGNISDGSSANLEISGNLTVTIIVKMDATTVDGYAFGKCNSGITNGYYALRHTASTAWEFVLRTSDGDKVIAGADIEDTNAHMIHCVHNATSNAKIYTDGTEDGSSTFNGTIDDTNGGFSIGRLGDFGANYAGGEIDEVRVANTNRSVGWMVTEYNNEMGAGFLSTTVSDEFAVAASSVFGFFSA